MKAIIRILPVLILLIFFSCTQQKNVQVKPFPFTDTGVNTEAWVKIPAGNFYKGLHRHVTKIGKPYEIMLTDVTNAQYARYLNEALAKDSIKVVNNKVMGYYPGDPFDGYKHEKKITPGDKVFFPLDAPGVRITFDGKTFSVIKGYENHPVTYVSWFGANAYAKFYGWRLPTENEWEKAARGTDTRSFPWGEEIYDNIANYSNSNKFLKKVFNRRVITTPVGFFNGKTYNGLQTRDDRSPYGLYDMAGNVWQWCGNDYRFMHYRFMRGGSHANYEYNLRVWARNSAGPEYYSMYVGFRCARDIPSDSTATTKSE